MSSGIRNALFTSRSESVVLCDCTVEDGSYLLILSVIADDPLDLSAQGLGFGDRRFEAAGPSTVAFTQRPARDVDVGALRREFDCAPASYATGCSCYDRGHAVERFHRGRR